MNIDLASKIVSRLGPCRIALNLSDHVALAHELSLMGCDVYGTPDGPLADGSGPRVGFVEWPRQDGSQSLAEVIRPFIHLDTLVLMTRGAHRAAIEATLFAAGLSRHPAGMFANDYSDWSGQTLPIVTYYQRLPEHGRGGALSRGGVAADAIIARYAFAATRVRAGDTVLVDGADSADGVRILGASCRGSRFRRVADAEGADGVEGSLRDIADHSLDMIVAVEPAMPQGLSARLDDYARVLKFDGRLILALREGSPGDNARPTSWQAFHDEVARRFITEQRHAQVPTTPDPQGPRTLIKVDLDNQLSLEWMIVSAIVDPLQGAAHRDLYSHPGFEPSGNPVAADFGAAYDNPWLYRSMVQMGERLGDEGKLAQLAGQVIATSRPDSADRGAALTVLGYRALELRAGQRVATLIGNIIDYLQTVEGTDAPPHVRRWTISLSFLAGRLCEMIGDRAAAISWFRMAAEGNWQEFSPILATKAVGGAFFGARLHLANGDIEAATAYFRHGMDVSLRAASAAHAEQLGNTERPLPFYLVELAEVIDMGSQCANALAHIDLYARDPGLFWRQIDMRRFGLGSWLRDLQRETQRLNTRLRQAA
ncbi:hypothetical protein [Sphingomonas quercus]|uniref:Uncharacterized protein n=1 Tax=Sphingomonas quercus TaxID=2842451 RepID=A0ABS6BK44_9SPHN|nr:hypothetical protein [Sphingomonas quercus]MBU3078668.1 hypothetical protein [Sphingomonas quercus]